MCINSSSGYDNANSFRVCKTLYYVSHALFAHVCNHHCALDANGIPEVADQNTGAMAEQEPAGPSFTGPPDWITANVITTISCPKSSQDARGNQLWTRKLRSRRRPQSRQAESSFCGARTSLRLQSAQHNHVHCRCRCVLQWIGPWPVRNAATPPRHTHAYMLLLCA